MADPLKDVLPTDRPMTASDKDRFVGQDELGNKIYETLAGHRYTVRPATQQERDARQPLPVQAKKWWDEGANLPSGEQVLNTLKAIPGEMVNTIDRTMKGEGTVGDFLDTAGMVAAPAAPNLVRAADADVLSALGASPRWRAVEKAATDSKEVYPTEFRSPLLEVFSEATFPKEGLKGSAILKEVQDNPDIRASEFKGMGLEIDPQKRYTKDELLDLLETNRYDVSTNIRKDYSGMQRQDDLLDPETDYFEVTVEANKPHGKTFRPAKGTHYTDNTIAHGRASIRNSDNGRYLLVEELQSDLLQHGFVKPATSESLNKLVESQTALIRDEIPTNFSEIGNSLADKYEKSMKAALNPSGEGEAGDLLKNWIDEAYNNPESVGKGPKEFDPNDPNDLPYDDLVDLDFEPLNEGQIDTIRPFESIDSFEADRMSLEDIKGEVSGTYEWALSDTGNRPYAFAKAWHRAVNLVTANSGSMGRYRLLDTVRPDIYREATSDVLSPPVQKTEETVTATMDALIAEAANRGITKIVIPPQSKIVEKRFRAGSDEYNKAMDPKSGFTATYTKALNSYLDKLKKGFGHNSLIVREVPMNYAETTSKNALQYVEDTITRDFHPLDELDLKKRFEQASPIKGDLIWLKRTSDQVAKKVQIPEESYQTFYQEVLRNLSNTEILSTKGAFYVAMKNLSDLLPKSSGIKGVEIDFTGLAEQGYDLSKPRFAEGGVVENVDPVSGNPVPTGSLPEEVRDDVDAKLSEGEYVLPADVVRYFGLSKIENLVAQAKKGLAEMDAKGRIGGKGEDDLPFSPEELQAVEDSPAQAPQGAPQVRMAVGGVVPPAQPTTPSTPQPELPEWMLQFGRPSDNTPEPAVAAPVRRPQVSNDRSQAERDAMMPTGMAGSVDQWATKDFVNYATQRTSNVNRGINSAINTFVPMGSVFTRLRQKYLEENVPKTMEQMLAAGKDLQGNVLSEEEKKSLQASYDKIKSESLPKGTGILGAVTSRLKEAVTGNSSKPSTRTETRDGVTYSGVSNKSSDSSMNSGSGPAWSSATRTNTSMSSSPRPQARPSSLAGGGLVKKRNK